MMTEKIFHRIDLAGTAPAGICYRCAQQGMEHRPTGSTFAYCRHTEVGVMRRPGGEWITAENIRAPDFQRAIALAIVEGEQAFIAGQTAGMSKN